MSDRTSVSGSPAESIPSTRGTGSKIIFRRSGASSSTRSVMVERAELHLRPGSPARRRWRRSRRPRSSAICTSTRNATGPLASRSDSSAARKSAVFVAACSAVRNSVPASGRMRNRPNRLCPSAFVNLNAVMAKYACRAKLVGIGFGASTKAFAVGCAARNATIGGGSGCPAARGDRPQELQELLAGADGEAVVRVGDDVRVDVVGQVEPDRHPLRAGPLRVVVGDRSGRPPTPRTAR